MLIILLQGVTELLLLLFITLGLEAEVDELNRATSFSVK